MKPLSHDTLRGNWATLLLANDDWGAAWIARARAAAAAEKAAAVG